MTLSLGAGSHFNLSQFKKDNAITKSRIPTPQEKSKADGIELKGKIINGFGTFPLKYGAYYTGPIKDGKPLGDGKVTFINGDWLMGDINKLLSESIECETTVHHKYTGDKFNVIYKNGYAQGNKKQFLSNGKLNKGFRIHVHPVLLTFWSVSLKESDK